MDAFISETIALVIDTCWEEGVDDEIKIQLTGQLRPAFEAIYKKHLVVAPVAAVGQVVPKITGKAVDSKVRGPKKGSTNLYQVFLKEMCDWDNFKVDNPDISYPTFKKQMGPEWEKIKKAETDDDKEKLAKLEARKEAFMEWVVEHPGKKYANFSEDVPIE